MKTRRLDLETWSSLQRLRAAGCPLDLEHLSAPHAPVRVFLLPVTEVPTLFPLSSGTGVAVRLRILAASAITIVNFHLVAPWLSAAVEWLPVCAKHPERYCFHESPRSLNFPKKLVLNRPRFYLRPMKPGMSIEGFLLGVAPGMRVEGQPNRRVAELRIENLGGDTYPFRLDLGGSKGDQPVTRDALMQPLDKND